MVTICAAVQTHVFWYNRRRKNTYPLMHNNPQRLAWTVLIIAFVFFLSLAITLPFGVRILLINSTREQSNTLSLGSGSVYVTRPAVGVPEALFGSMDNLTYRT